AFGEFEAFGQCEDLRIRRHDRVEPRIFANDFNIYFTWRDGDWRNAALVKLELCLAHVDVIGRRIRKRTVDSENRELDFLLWLNAAIYYQPIRRVPTFHDRTPALAQAPRHLVIYPDFGIIID